MHTDTIDPFFEFNQKGENKMLHAESTDKIINLFFKVYNTPGYGFLEKVYENALVIELKRAEFNVLQQQNVKVFYENQVVGDYFADIIADQVILERMTGKKDLNPKPQIRAYPSNPCHLCSLRFDE